LKSLPDAYTIPTRRSSDLALKDPRKRVILQHPHDHDLAFLFGTIQNSTGFICTKRAEMPDSHSFGNRDNIFDSMTIGVTFHHSGDNGVLTYLIPYKVNVGAVGRLAEFYVGSRKHFND